MFGIPLATLTNKVIGEHNKTPSGQTVLRAPEKRILAETLTTVSRWEFPLTKPYVHSVVKKCVDKRVQTSKTIFHFLTLLIVLYEETAYQHV